MVSRETGFVLYRGTFPELKRKLRYFFFDEFFRGDASKEDMLEALGEIYLNISSKYGVRSRRYVPERILNLKIAVASCAYKYLESSVEAAKILHCSRSTLIKHTPKEIRMKPVWPETINEKKREATSKKFMETVNRIGPCFYEDLMKELKITYSTVIARVKRHEAEGLIENRKIPITGRGTYRYRAKDLLDGLTSYRAPRHIVWII